MSGALLKWPRHDLLRIKELFYENHGYLRIKELKSYGLKLTDIRQLQEEDIIERVDTGLFHWQGTSEFAKLADVQDSIPDGVFTLLSALYFHGLIEKQPSLCYVAVTGKPDRYDLPNYPKIQLLPQTKAHFELGLLEIDVDGTAVRFYDREKTLCECMKYRNRIDEAHIAEAFRTYRASEDFNPEKLWEYGLEMRMKLLMNRYVNRYL